MAEAGKRTTPFFMESDTVGSIVTIAVITANTGGQPNNSQIHAVRKIDTPVFTTRLPTK